MQELQRLSSICLELFHIEKTEKININGKEIPEATNKAVNATTIIFYTL